MQHASHLRHSGVPAGRFLGVFGPQSVHAREVPDLHHGHPMNVIEPDSRRLGSSLIPTQNGGSGSTAMPCSSVPRNGMAAMAWSDSLALVL